MPREPRTIDAPSALRGDSPAAADPALEHPPLRPSVGPNWHRVRNVADEELHQLRRSSALLTALGSCDTLIERLELFLAEMDQRNGTGTLGAAPALPPVEVVHA